MTSIDPMVAALITLCKNEGGYKFVADKAKVSPDNLWQIISGTKLPSGNPRGVGPALRSKITAAYPTWLAPSQDSVSTNKHSDLTGHATGTVNFGITLGQSVEFLAGYLAALDLSDRKKAMREIADLVDEPERHAKITASIEAMAATAFAQAGRRAA